ncbi:MAG: ABC transporter substrate-binding protein [Clostridiales bacterium]|nr:ABC transporter substrate-binding protein [Clostridiales bacterium]
MKKTISKIMSCMTIAVIMGTTLICSTACDSREEIIVYNWGEYISEDDDSTEEVEDTIALFEEAFPQYKVVYSTFETNETMYPNLDNTYDVIIPSEYMVCRLIGEERIQPLDWDLLPNVTKYMDPMFKDISYSNDKKRSDEVLDYAIPYLYCTVGLVYDANKIDLPEGTTDPKEIWGVVFDEANVGKIGMYDSMRESIGVALNYLGYSINSMDKAELDAAKELLISQKKEIRPAYGVDNLKDKMVSGELSASVTWSGDHIVMLDRLEELGKEDVDLQFVLPEGSNWSIDMMCIPTNSKNVEGAHAFINFMYDPQIALYNCEFVGYSTPNTAARDMLDPEVANNIYYYPTSEVISTLEVYYTSSEIEEKYTDIWNTVGAN